MNPYILASTYMMMCTVSMHTVIEVLLLLLASTIVVVVVLL